MSWSVDGGWLALLAAPGGSPRTQVWLLRPDGSSLHRVEAQADCALFLGPWTHRPGVIALAASASARAPGHAFLYDAETRALTPVIAGDQPIVLDVDQELRIALVRRGPRGARSVWWVDLHTRRAQPIAPRSGPGSTEFGRLAPDGHRAYVCSNAGAEMFGLFEASLPDGHVRLIAERPDAELEQLLLQRDGRRALLLWNFAGRSEAELLCLRTYERTQLTLPLPVAHDGAFSADGQLLALTLEGPTQPRALWSVELASSQWRQVTQPGAGFQAPDLHPTLECLRSFDGVQISGWLHRSRPQPAAALIHLHGGPEAQERPAWNPLFLALACAGISVFAPNVRGSSGFGRTFMSADDRERRWDAMRDVLACAQFIRDHQLATPERLACGGRSYGGYLTLAMLVFHPEQFAAGLDVCGMADLETFYAHTEPFIARAAFPKYGHPQHDAALLRALSPIHRFNALRAPLLVVHGENDSNVPLEESEQVVARARERGIPVDYVRFAGEGHELAQLAHREQFVRHSVRWLCNALRVSA